MKQSLRLNLGQHLNLTPQLQQAIKLLQLSTIDLRQEIQQQIEQNPLLDAAANDELENGVSQSSKSERLNEEFNDFQWSHLYSSTNSKNQFSESEYNYDKFHCTTISLQDYLYWQLGLTPMTDIDRSIAATIIDASNSDGFLTVKPKDLYMSLCGNRYALDFDEFEAVRHLIMRFDPIGCACISLSESLLIQLEQLPKSTPHLKLINKIVQNDIKLLGQHNYRELRKKYNVSESNLSAVIATIRKLKPKPGNVISQEASSFIIPDLTLKKINNEWKVYNNNSILPKLSINRYYASLINNSQNQSDCKYLKNHLQEARWFLKSIQNREATLLKVGRYIVDVQKEFFNIGDPGMKPLILGDVAQALGVHESTVSRATTQKYIHTPRGLFELKYFFSNHLQNTSGENCSSTAIRAQIKKIVAEENHAKPLSDNKIAQKLKVQGISVARRTITKYREMIGIPPSNERKCI